MPYPQHPPVVPAALALPHPHALEDAEAQLAYAAEAVAPLLALLAERCQDAPPANPAHRPRYEQNRALLRGLTAYCAAVENLTNAHGEQVRWMRAEMGRAQARHAQMGIERDYCLAELQSANARYYAALDLETLLRQRHPALLAPPPLARAA